MLQRDFAPAGIPDAIADELADKLQQRLRALLDLGLTLKHVHWNVMGPGFIAVHEMLDDQVAAVRDMADEVAERIATLGAIPNGLPGNLVRHRTWDDYSLGRGVVTAHLGALDKVYDGVIGDHRTVIDTAAGKDAVTEDMLVGQLGKLELFQWFVRAHIQNTSGELLTEDSDTELDAAAAAATGDPLV